MNTAEIVIVCIVGVAFIAALAAIIVRKIKHKGSCDCGCANCSHACSFKRAENKEK